jgi:RNA polymerase sigma-70 factor (ECF subfamily)
MIELLSARQFSCNADPPLDEAIRKRFRELLRGACIQRSLARVPLDGGGAHHGSFRLTMSGNLKTECRVDGASDADLVHWTAARNPSAFAELMRRNNRKLFRVARGVMDSDDEAEDVLQSAWTLAFQSASQFRGEAAASTWLVRIVLNEAFGRRRRVRPTVPIEQLDGRPPAQIITFPRDADNPEANMERAQIRDMLESAIDELPARFRIVFMMRDVEEMSVEEVAIALDLPEATVKTRAHRARARLKDALKKRFNATLSESFSFDGDRCRRITERVFNRLSLNPPR